MLFIYRCLINFLFPLIILIIFFRKFFKKEDKKRYKEKLFATSFKVKKNIKNKLIWIHAASIGEIKSISPIIQKLHKKNKYEFLITSVSLSSSKFIKSELAENKNITHRFFPIDKLSLVKKFLDGWSPNLVIFVDSEIWPNFLLEINDRKIPLTLINARITKKTFNRWTIISRFAKQIFNTFDLCLAASKESKKYLEKLNARNLKYVGNIKLSGIIKNQENNDRNENFLKNKKFWCAASTHKGEEILCIKTHNNLKKKYQNLITVIIPRHINRCKEIEEVCKKNNISAQILEANGFINPKSEILIINSFGQLPKYFKLTKSVFMGKSLLKSLELVGGQNPIEAALLGCKIYHGPYVYNFNEIYKLLNNYKISEVIKNEKELSKKLMNDLGKNKKKMKKMTSKIKKLGKKILSMSLKEIIKIQKK
jgi:3-deoxy-D-manno-octulosonic-acid transferase